MGNKLLNVIKDELWKGASFKEIELGGHKWKLKTLNDGETVWRDKYVQASASYSFVTSQRAPTVAVSLIEIDGVPVRDLVLSDDEKSGDFAAAEDWLRVLGFSSVSERYKVAEKVLEWLQELPTEIVEELYKVCLELERNRREIMEKVLKKTLS